VTRGSRRFSTSVLIRKESTLAQEVLYLIITRSGARNVFAIGFLAIALLSGGIVTLDFANFRHAPTAQVFEPDTVEFPPLAIVPRHENRTLTSVLAGTLDLIEHVSSAVRPPTPVTPPMKALVTHYGESYNGQVLGCGYGLYSSDNPTIVAVSPERYGEMPCGTMLQICGDGGCIIATRQDACPGCSGSLFDLSESAFAGVCGVPTGVCSATINVVEVCDTLDLAWIPGDDAIGPEETAHMPLQVPSDPAAAEAVICSFR